MPGPLTGLRVVEMTAIGPVPFAGMLLADMGADVIRIERRSPHDVGLPGRRETRFDIFLRGRHSVSVDLKSATGRDLVLRLIGSADVLIEGFRPGVMERLGLGPQDCHAKNPRLVYGRMTGYGQSGPLKDRAGHDINYIALTGALHAIGRRGERPVPPLTLIGDFGGGAMFLAFGLLAALLEARSSGKGQVIDCAMTDGAAYLMSAFYALSQEGTWRDRRGENILDGAAPWYDTYETKDGRYLAVGAIETRFYAELVDTLGLAQASLPHQHDPSGWPELRRRFAEAFKTRTRDEWERHFEGSDACVTPVLSILEAPLHPHNRARATFVEQAGVTQPAPQPIFSRTPGEAGHTPVSEANIPHESVLIGWGFSKEEVAAFLVDGIIGPDA